MSTTVTLYFIKLVLLTTLVVALVACGGGGSTESTTTTTSSKPVFSGPDKNDVITFETVTPATFGELLNTGDALPKTNVTGTLYLPTGVTGKVPAVVMSHGSSGVTASNKAWADFLNTRGIAVFIVDSYTARGVTETSTSSPSFNTHATRIADAMFALAVLGELPQIDSTRIGILANGGATAIGTTFSEIKQTINTFGKSFIVHIALYPSCNIRQWSNNISSAPILILHGQDDDYNSAAACTNFAGVLTTAGANVSIKTYAGADHGFDATGSPAYDPNRRSYKNCAGEFRLDTRILRRFDNAQVFSTSAEYRDYIDTCRTTGVTIGGNATARTQARQEVDSLLTTVFGL